MIILLITLIASASLVHCGVYSDPPNYAPQYSPGAQETVKNVFVFESEDTPTEYSKQIVTIPQDQPNQENVIFVRVKPQSFHQETEVVLPQMEPPKTLVHVLVGQNMLTSNVVVQNPPPTNPPQVAVNFVKYAEPNLIVPQQMRAVDYGSNIYAVTNAGGYA